MMGTLLKAEIRYSLPAWFIAYGICACFLLAAALLPKWDVWGFITQTSITYMVMTGILGAAADEEKRTRANALLPLTPRAVALLDICYIAVFQLTMIAFWIAFLAIKPQYVTARSFFGMVTTNGVTLAVITLFIIHTHLGYFGGRRYRLITYALPILVAETVAVLIYTGWLGAAIRWIGRHYVSWTGALTATLAWLLLSWISVVVYERRRSYLS